MASAYIIAGSRTPQGKFLGGLASASAAQLGGHAIRAACERSRLDPATIDQVIMGQVILAGAGQAPARQASTLAGLPASVGAVTVNKVCGSSLYAVMLADMAIRAGEYHRVVAGGMESMSQAPHLLRGGRSGWKYGQQSLLDTVDVDGLRCAHLHAAMGDIGEALAQSASISRQDQDQWAQRSHQRAIAAQDANDFVSEITPVQVSEGKKLVTRELDENPRRDCNLETLGKLSPAFTSSPRVEPTPSSALKQSSAPSADASPGTVTAGNASSLSDGGAALVIVDEQTFQNSQTDWAFRIVAHCNFAAAHQNIFTAPVGAVRELLRKTRRSAADIDLFEINEAFASQTIACVRELQLDEQRVNVRGGAIALGHPLGASGARVLVTLLHALVALNLNQGIASLCLGGGEAVAMLVERVR